ncbi:Glycosyltransferase involved in cell wall bisynthesis [Brevibacterium linens]|uniref:Glycosyltransferase involved in cell wall bisynthesis n=2 Tax=Brevibacterium linens TaxID=1703 RepID=A0A2H1K5W6_BRELN|nr:Glycosyltransferase involved in cell wall bisynthesis [Brevibacterium linens]
MRAFGACHESMWALDVLSERFTEGKHDWSSLRAAAARFAEEPRAFDQTLDRMSLKDLWALSELLHARELDRVSEQALLKFISTRVLAGADFDRKLNELLIERLLHVDLVEPARVLISRLDDSTWRKQALAAELEHPRFGGTLEGTLIALNPSLYRYGLERISLSGHGDSGFQQLQAEATGIVDEGPLVSVIMTTDQPTANLVASARSIIEQSYQNLELIVVAGSSGESEPVLDQLAALDSRIKIIRSSKSVSQYDRRNDAIDLADGSFITFHSDHAWAHPRRVETQVRDLVENNGKLANIVRKARVSDDLSLVSSRGARLVLSESSILFRRDAVIDEIGYFDGTRKGAGTEYRKRLEAATGARVETIGPRIPLEFALVDATDDAQDDFEGGLWIDPVWLEYREAYSQFHNRISAGQQSAYIRAGSGRQAFAAPARWTKDSPSSATFDVLLILDGRRTPRRNDFIEAVIDELYSLIATGARVAVMQSDSADGADRPGPVADALHELVQSGKITQIFEGDEVEADVAIVRHAVAVQGHSPQAQSLNVKRVVVVEDIVGGDLRARTFAQVDVDETLKSWTGADPEWVIATPLIQRPVLHSVVMDDGTMRVTISAPDSHQLVAVRFDNGEDRVDLPATVSGDEDVFAEAQLDDLPVGELLVSIVRRHDIGESVQGCIVKHQRVLSAIGDRILVASGRLLRLLPNVAQSRSDESVGFGEQYLDVSVTSARIFRGQIELSLLRAPEVQLTALHLLRVVDGRVRRHEFELDEPVGTNQIATRTVEGILDSRWKVFGVFQTPVGPVSVPVDFGPDTPTTDSKNYRIRKLTSGSAGVIHIVEQPQLASPDRTPFLSIVMPVFNVAPYLDTSIQSVLMQDFEDFELIIVDDASTDNGRQVIEMHRALDDRVRVIELDHNTLGGAGVPSNLGIRAARGKYIAFVDSDDWVTKSAFSRLVELAETNDAQLVIGDFRTFDENDRSFADAYDGDRWRNIPLEQVISASSHPSLLRLSPVPWRKLYRSDFVRENHVLYPEGDYFYEDNPLHWHVLSRAERVVACDGIVSYHRMAREGQTMGAFEYKLGAIASHANTILESLKTSTAAHREVLFEEFIDYVSRQRWIVRRQTQPAAAKIIQHRLADIYDRAREIEPTADVPQKTISHFAGYRSAYPDLDLTIVIPVYNSADLLRDTLDSVMALDGLAFDVLLIDDGSTDQSLKVMREYERKYANVHVFEQKNRGAGRARNSIIPLCTGRYTYFLDADDVINANALRQAIIKADNDESDLMFVQYRIEYVDEGRSRGMFNADSEIWKQLKEVTKIETKRRLLSGLINYPWNRIIKTQLLHDANIFFGPTVVHNDVLYHWHSILSAINIGILETDVCTHRKFVDRQQVTNIADERRMSVLEALRGTHERISDLPAYAQVREQWETFSLELIEWAKTKIPERLLVTYEANSRELAKAILEEASSRDPKLGI